MQEEDNKAESKKENKKNRDENEERKLIGGRYIFMQSGFPVEKKTLQYQNLNGLLYDVQYYTLFL